MIVHICVCDCDVHVQKITRYDVQSYNRSNDVTLKRGDTTGRSLHMGCAEMDDM